jgi:hypothetical protein
MDKKVPHGIHHSSINQGKHDNVAPAYGGRYGTHTVPKFKIPSVVCDFTGAFTTLVTR